MNFMLTILLNR